MLILVKPTENFHIQRRAKLGSLGRGLHVDIPSAVHGEARRLLDQLLGLRTLLRSMGCSNEIGGI